MRRRLAVWLVGSALLATVVFLVGCAVSVTPSGVTKKHPAFTPGTACNATGCHDTYKHKEPYTGPCNLCHNTSNWKTVTYTHKDPNFNEGTHALVGCPLCHTEGQSLPNGACVTCHDAPHGGWTGCSNCHIPIAWRLVKPVPSGHLSLLGGHSKLTCQDCHKAPQEPAVPRTCTNCHGTNHGGLTNCQDCHDPALGWGKPKPNFNHNEFWVRVGIHAKLACTKCHPNNRFAGTPTQCVGCHGVQHGGLTQCGQCHTPAATAGFKFTTFKHNSVFVLLGAHLTAYNKGRCSECHPKGLFAKVTGTTCAGCHRSGNPNTIPAGSPHKGSVTSSCQVCHTPYGFDFAHLIKPFKAHPIPLGGRHAQLPCTLCHTSLVFSQPTKSCVSCHFAGSTNPPGIPHVGPTNCISCHWPTTWNNTHFTHPIIGGFGFPVSPHTSTEFGPYPTGCINCHPADAASNGNPDFTHFSCSKCHSL